GKTRVAHEGFEPYDTASRHRRHVSHVSRNQSTPETEVRDGDGLECGALAIAVDRGQHARRRVERHVHERGSAASGEGTTTRLTAFPRRSARFVEMDMDVDQPWHDDESVCVDLGTATGDVTSHGDD